MSLLKHLLWNARNLHLHLERLADRLNAYSQWSKPVKKARGHVSGDALTQWRYNGIPSPNIWGSNLPRPVRQPWIPDVVPDEHIKDYEESFAGHLARLGWQEQQITGESGMTDIAGSILSAKRDEALRRQT